MNWLIRRLILFLLIINVHSQEAFSQNLEEIVKYSDQLFEKGNFELSVNEYNRALFFGSTESDKICLKIANCYFKMKKLDQSIQFYDRAYFSSNSDSIKTEAILGKSFSLILDKNYMLAISELLNLDSTKIAYHNIKLNFLKGIAYFGLHQDEFSELYFERCYSQISKVNHSEIMNEFNSIRKNEKRFNPKTAYFLSLVLPGVGQFYSGAIKEGLNSIVLLDGLLVGAIFLAKEYSIFLTFVSILPWYQRYYLGGANKAEKLTLEKQTLRRNDSYQIILKKIEIAYLENMTN